MDVKPGEAIPCPTMSVFFHHARDMLSTATCHGGLKSGYLLQAKMMSMRSSGS